MQLTRPITSADTLAVYQSEGQPTSRVAKQQSMLNWTLLALTFGSVVLAAVAVAAVISYDYAKTVQEHQIDLLEEKAQRHRDDIRSRIEETETVTKLLADNTYVRAITNELAQYEPDEAKRQLGKDPRAGLSRKNVNSVTTLIEKFVSRYDGILQARIIAVRDDGHEIVRMDRTRHGIKIYASAELSAKGHRTYFQDTIAAAKGELVSSPFELNMEGGVVQEPLTLVMRTSIPLYASGQREPSAILIINWSGQHLLTPENQEEDSVLVLDHAGNNLLEPTLRIVQPEHPHGNARAELTGATGEALLADAHDTNLELSIVSKAEDDVSKLARESVRKSTVLPLTIVILLIGGPALVLARIISQREANSVTQIIGSEARARESEAMLASQQYALDTAGIVAITDSSGVITHVNDNFCKISGYERAELIGKTHAVVNSGHHPKSFWVNMWKTIASGQPWREEVCNRAKDGSLYWVDTTVVPVLGNTGKPDKYIALRVDVTWRKEAELRTQEAKKAADQALQRLKAYQTAIDRHSIVALTDTKGNITEVNDLFCKISGYTRHELVGANQRIVNSGTHPKNFWVEMWRTIAQGETWHGEVCNRRKDGTLYWVETSISPLRDIDGKISGYCAVRTDITHQRERENRMREITKALDAAHDSVFIFEADTLHIAYANKGATDQVGHSIHELADMTLVDFMPDTTSQGFDELAQPLRDQPGSAATFRTVLGSNDGATMPVEITMQLVPELGESGRFVAVVRDITEQLSVETGLVRARSQAEAASRAKDEFLANMSHEIRTPMTAILGYTDLLLEQGSHKADIDEFAKTIRRNAKHLLTIINDILDMSKIEAGKMTVELIETDLQQILSEVSALMEPKAHDKGLKFSITHENTLPTNAHTDPTRLRQVILNLVGNALKFTETGTIDINTRYEANTHDGTSRITIAVKDSGIGMTPQQLEAISRFDAFSQADTSTTRKFGGSGLGLRISHHLAKMLGGDLNIESTHGSGSTFTVTISAGDPAQHTFERATPAPAPTAASETPQQPTTAPPQPAKPLTGVRILLAEDGPDNQKLISHHLGKAGADVTIADNGRIAVDTVHARAQDNPSDLPFDVIFMDMQMPELDGYGAAALLREEGWTIPIIALTAHAMSGDRERCIQAGCSDYATKPINPKQLVESAAKWAQGEDATGQQDAAQAA